MSYKNLPNTEQRYHGNHHVGCGCLQGQHIWDEDYDDKNEKWCVCCEHFFPTEDAEIEALDSAIEWPDGSSNKPATESKNKQPDGMRKGKIVRRQLK